MAKYKIGSTDGGDAGIDLSWEQKIDLIDGAVLITKNITPEFIEAVLRHKDKLIIHATTTGFGGTVLEPNVPHWSEQIKALRELISRGFPQDRTVIRVDPIIPTPKGCLKAKKIILWCMFYGFARYRVSMIDMYPHVRDRFIEAGLPIPYDGKFSPGSKEVEAVNNMLNAVKSYWQEAGNGELRIEACAEPGLTEAEQCGCISSYDLELLGLEPDTPADGVGYQRKDCMCYAGKVELLTTKQQCPHKCLYCFWRT